jgi:hypothetical protein
MSQPTAAPTGRILLKNVRISFANGVFEAGVIPGADADAKPKYNCGLILEPDHPQIAELTKKMKAVAAEKWPGNDKSGKPAWQALYNTFEKTNKLALHDGDLKPNYDGYPGNMYLSPSAKESERPSVILTLNGVNVSRKDFEGDPKGLAEFEKLCRSRIYSGAYVNASLDIWAQDNNFGKRINAQLRGVQFLRDGDAFAAGRPAESDEFETVTEGADAEDFA